MGRYSDPQLRGLEATARGEVIRTYTGSVCTITGPVGSKALWELMRAGLIAYGPNMPWRSKNPMVLTPRGQTALFLWERRARLKARSNPESPRTAELPQ